MSKRVVVTGMGCLSPVGNNVKDTWDSILAGRSGAAMITHFDASKHKTRFAAEVKGLNAAEQRNRAHPAASNPARGAAVRTSASLPASGGAG